MRRFIAIHLLAIFLYYSAGYFPVFIYRLQGIKREVKMKLAANMDESSLTRFTFTNSEYQSLHWKEKREFYFGNALFDVITEIHPDSNHVVILCLNDSQEQSLYSYANEQARRNQSESENNNGFLKLIASAFITDSDSWVVSPPVTDCFIATTVLESSFHPDIPSPPPRQV